MNVGDCVYYLRADTPEEKQNWFEVLESAKVCIKLMQNFGYGWYTPLLLNKLNNYIIYNLLLRGSL